MRDTRIIYTNGTHTVLLFWIHHAGSTVYWSHPGGVHRAAGKAKRIEPTLPGGGLRECLHRIDDAAKHDLLPMSSILFENQRNRPQMWAEAPEFAMRPNTSLLVADVGSMPDGVMLRVNCGIVAPDRDDLLRRVMERYSNANVLLATDVHPWVYACVSWGGNIDDGLVSPSIPPPMLLGPASLLLPKPGDLSRS